MKKWIQCLSLGLVFAFLLCSCSGPTEVAGSTGTSSASQAGDAQSGPEFQSGVQVGDSFISWANMALDNPDLNLTPEQLEVLKYSDNDYFGVSELDALQRYPDAYRGTQIVMGGLVAKILAADDATFECVVDRSRFSMEDPPSNELFIVRGKQPAGARVVEGDFLDFYGRYLDMESVEIDGATGQYPVISANFHAPASVMGPSILFGLDTIEPVAKALFGDDVKIREPIISEDYDLDALHNPQYDFYIVTPGNQSNDSFRSFEFSQNGGLVRDTRATADIMRTFSMAADFEHYYLTVYDKGLELFYLECYDRDFKKVWGREFHNVDTVPFDYTSEVIYLAADNDLYVIDAATGEDVQPPVMVGQKVKVNLLADGVVLVGLGEKDNLMKVDLEGNILWRASVDIDVTHCDMLQVVNGRVVASLLYTRELTGDYVAPGVYTTLKASMAVVDENGAIVSEFTTYEATPQTAPTTPTAPASEENTVVMIVDADGGLNLRAGPGTDYESLGLIPKGTIIMCPPGITQDSGWISVTYAGQSGYILAEHLIPG